MLCGIQHNIEYVAVRIMWADSPYHPAAHENTPYLSNIISFTQSAARKAISPVFALHGRSDPGSAASQSAMALAFISMSISA